MRVAVLVATVALVAGIVTWNVVFDRAIESAQQRYLALQRERPGAVAIRQVMDPAIHDAAAAATAWAIAVAAGCAVVSAGVLRLTRGRPAGRQAPTAN